MYRAPVVPLGARALRLPLRKSPLLRAWYECHMADDDEAVYDDVADAYSSVLDREGTGLVDPILTELLGDVAGRKVLSVACGQGQDARLLARLGALVTGIDLSAQMLRHARAHEAATPRGIVYIQGDAQELAEFPDRT